MPASLPSASDKRVASSRPPKPAPRTTKRAFTETNLTHLRGPYIASELHGQRQLFRDHGRLGLQPEGAAVADAMLLRQRRDLIPHRLRLIPSKVGPPCVEPLVVVELTGVVAGQRLEEVLPRSWPQAEQVRPDTAGPRLPRGPHDLSQRLGPARD